MRKSTFVVVAWALPAAILAVFSASGVGAGSSDVVYRAAGPHRAMAAGVTAVGRTRSLRVVYLGPNTISIKPQGEAGGAFTCPARTFAVSGIVSLEQEAARGQVVVSNSNPFGVAKRKWDIGVRNLSDQTQSYGIGAVCVGV
jgi:hypothetical protein